jgi:pyruvate/2-oxoglutarate dehydrogenase complex dihydrolipoamide dehydrogenase (E3) component
MQYDAIIIGSGQGGTPLARRLADLGKTVALIERKELGGTCINTGCTPTKTMIASAQVAHYARNATRWGVRTTGVTVDLPAIVARKDRIVQRFRAGHQRRVDARANLHLYRGAARFLTPHSIRVGEQVVEGEHIFIDTGTRPRIPHVPGLDTVPFLTNATLMELSALPDHLLVLGGGYIGLEFGQMFHRFGSAVTVIHQHEQILPREDVDVVTELQQALEAEGLHFLLNARTTTVEQNHGQITLTLERANGSLTVSGSHLLVATGRTPNTEELDLDKAGVETDKDGFVTVNNRLETNVPGIWALGDVKGGPAFTHISYHDFQIIYGNLVEGKNLSTEHRIVPYAVFTDPQLGGVGITEKEARARGYRLKIGKSPMTAVARAIERDETAGLMKLVVDAATDRILGASILGTEGGELVQILSTLMLTDLPYTMLKGAIYIHPTLAEGFFGLMEEVKPVDEPPRGTAT